MEYGVQIVLLDQKYFILQDINIFVGLYSSDVLRVVLHSASPPFQEGGPKFWKFQKGGNLKKNFGMGETKRGGGFSKKGGTQLLKLNLGIEKNKVRTFRVKLA